MVKMFFLGAAFTTVILLVQIIFQDKNKKNLQQNDSQMTRRNEAYTSNQFKRDFEQNISNSFDKSSKIWMKDSVIKTVWINLI